jgi:hypothetical protein
MPRSRNATLAYSDEHARSWSTPAHLSPLTAGQFICGPRARASRDNGPRLSYAVRGPADALSEQSAPASSTYVLPRFSGTSGGRSEPCGVRSVMVDTRGFTMGAGLSVGTTRLNRPLTLKRLRHAEWARDLSSVPSPFSAVPRVRLTASCCSEASCCFQTWQTPPLKYGGALNE